MLLENIHKKVRNSLEKMLLFSSALLVTTIHKTFREQLMYPLANKCY